jgi:GDP-L-fucose synthase
VGLLNLSEHRVCVTGGAGFLGRVVCQKLCQAGLPENQLFVPRRKEFDLTREEDVHRLYDIAKPTVVVHLAAEVGGIGANREHPGRFFFANMAMGLHLIEQARERKLAKFVQIGTVCAYPKFTPVPFKEEDLWNGYPEETNAPYGIAKKSLFVMLEAYRQEYGLASSVVVPVNLYGPGDNFDPQSSHVIPALIRKVQEAQQRGDKSIVCWGTGSASREFLYVDDAAAGIVAATLKMETPEPINLGNGKEIVIRDLIHLIADLCEFKGQIEWDTTKPDGQPRRCLDIARAKQLLDWQPVVSFEDGMRRTIDWWRDNSSTR